MLETLAAETFASSLNERFEFVLDDRRFDLDLVEIFFSGPAEPILPRQTY